MKSKILIVEDDMIQSRMLEHTLTKEGYQVLSSIDGFEALEILKNNIVDLIISDVLMDKMDGFELKKQINKNPEWKKIPFIFLTNQNNAESKSLAEEIGAELFLIKPYVKFNISDIVKNLVPIKQF
ncbi:MAG: response regulator [Candidatus Sericytochromatia bacterium]